MYQYKQASKSAQDAETVRMTVTPKIQVLKLKPGRAVFSCSVTLHAYAVAKRAPKVTNLDLLRLLSSASAGAWSAA